MKSTNGDNQNWWSTLPGLITASATLLTAVGGLIVVLNTNGCLKVQTANSVTKSNSDTISNLFVENFDSNANEWFLAKTDYHQIRIVNGKLYITCNPNGTYDAGRTSTWSKFNLEKFFPKYQIDVICNLVSEQQEGPYGFILTNDGYTEYYQVNYYAKGYGNLLYVKDDSIVDVTDSLGVNSPKNNVKLTFKVNGNSYKYYIDNFLIKEGSLKFFDFNTIRLFASSTQTVEFDDLKVTSIQ